MRRKVGSSIVELASSSWYHMADRVISYMNEEDERQSNGFRMG